jgi:elongation factor Tu
VTGVEAFGRTMERGEAGDTIGAPIQSGKAVTLEPGLGFAIREGGLTVDAGTVLTVTD